MLGIFAGVETNLRRERQLEGIAAKARGVYKGWKPSIDAATAKRLLEQEELDVMIFQSLLQPTKFASSAVLGTRRQQPCQEAVCPSALGTHRQ